VVRNRSSNKQSDMKLNPALIKFARLTLHNLKIWSFHQYCKNFLEEWVENCCEGEICKVNIPYQSKKRIRLKISELYSKRHAITYRNVWWRYSNKTVTLVVHSAKYSYRRVTKKPAQLHSIQSIGASARVKSPSTQFSYRVKSPNIMVHLQW